MLITRKALYEVKKAKKKKKKNKIKIIQVLLNQKWFYNSKNSPMSEN